MSAADPAAFDGWKKCAPAWSIKVEDRDRREESSGFGVFRTEAAFFDAACRSTDIRTGKARGAIFAGKSEPRDSLVAKPTFSKQTPPNANYQPARMSERKARAEVSGATKNKAVDAVYRQRPCQPGH